ncbi:MAG TPA: fasciclin domain-containing protein, partial [Draconibacterium sp.]|nr:fasciclin domain-containing protein [Draconibacterium sp.]
MRKITIFIFLLPVILLSSCIGDEILEAGFKDTNRLTIYDFLEQNKEEYSSFIAILEKGGIYKTLSAKNPEAAGYTLFLPNNKAVEEFINGNSQFSSLNDLLNNQEYISALSRYHVLRKGIKTSEFPFGAFAETNLTDDYLTVSFIIEPDTAYYKINNQAAVIKPNIEV